MKKSVLLVEDEESIALALVVVMKSLGCVARRVSSGTDALEELRSQPPDLLILDVMLPGCSGYEVCQQVRRDPALDRMKILMMTAKGSDIEARKGLALGADAFMAKPFSMAVLKSEVRRLLAEEP